MLLLDEPASGQTEEETQVFATLLRRLAADGIAVVLVEHDVPLVMQVCDHIHVLDFGADHRRRIAGRDQGRPQRPGGLPGLGERAGQVTIELRPLVGEESLDDAPLLELRGITAAYESIEVLHGVDLTVPPGKVVALLGPNGAGKSTTLRVVAGLHPALEGDLIIAGRRVNGAAPRSWPEPGCASCPKVGACSRTSPSARTSAWPPTPA